MSCLMLAEAIGNLLKSFMNLINEVKRIELIYLIVDATTLYFWQKSLLKERQIRLAFEKSQMARLKRNLV